MSKEFLLRALSEALPTNLISCAAYNKSLKKNLRNFIFSSFLTVPVESLLRRFLNIALLLIWAAAASGSVPKASGLRRRAAAPPWLLDCGGRRHSGFPALDCGGRRHSGFPALDCGGRRHSGFPALDCGEPASGGCDAALALRGALWPFGFRVRVRRCSSVFALARSGAPWLSGLRRLTRLGRLRRRSPYLALRETPAKAGLHALMARETSMERPGFLVDPRRGKISARTRRVRRR
jgi:hypothetical protein